MTKNEMPASIAAHLGFMQAQTPYEAARRLHTDAMAFITMAQPQNAIKACEQALAILDGAGRLSPTAKGLQKNLGRTLVRAQKRAFDSQPY